jgi:hypothetical protein
MGIPNKLGVMLNGPPGTGKTSTLAAIATYLEKDLYYLHLNDIRTNADLKLVFDFVFKKCSEGGVIVMEDIDAMSNVVAKRNTSDSSVSLRENARKHDPDESLTLEFFLNVLQGTLTLDGSVFVATTNHLDTLDPAFYRRGRFDVIIEMGAADAYQIKNMYRRFFSRDVPASLLERIPERVHAPAEFISHFAQYLLRSELVDDETVLAPFLTSTPSLDVTLEISGCKPIASPDPDASEARIAPPISCITPSSTSSFSGSASTNDLTACSSRVESPVTPYTRESHTTYKQMALAATIAMSGTRSS